MKKKKERHIVICTPGFARNEQDTTCIPPLQLYVSQLAKIESLKVTVLALHYPKKKVYVWNNVQVISVGAGNNKLPFRLINWRQYVKELNKIHKENTIDVLHSFWATDVAFLVNRFAKKRNLKHFITLMGQDVLKTNRYFKHIKPKSFQLIAVSNRQNNVLLDTFNIKSEHVVPWGVEDFNIKNNSNRPIDVIGIGSLTALKNFSLFVKVVSELKNKELVKNVLLIGDGPEKNKLKLLAKEKRVDDVITFTGKLERESVLEYLLKSKVLLHTSKFESLGYVFQEAMAAKTCIVSTPVGLAEPKAYWRIGNDKITLVEKVKETLLDDKQPLFEVSPIEETVANYLKVYFKK